MMTPSAGAAATGLLLAALGLTSASAIVLVSEAAPYVVSGLSPERRFSAISGGDYQPGLSLSSKEIYLRDCLEVPVTFYALAQPTDVRRRFADTCLREATGLNMQMPAYALPWLVKATLAGNSGDYGAMFEALRRAHDLAPNTHWLAELRTSLFEKHLEAATPGDAQVYQADIRALITSEVGARVVARRYVQRTELREYITQAAESAAAPHQQRFLSMVKQIASGT